MRNTAERQTNSGRNLQHAASVGGADPELLSVLFILAFTLSNKLVTVRKPNQTCVIIRGRLVVCFGGRAFRFFVVALLTIKPIVTC